MKKILVVEDREFKRDLLVQLLYKQRVILHHFWSTFLPEVACAMRTKRGGGSRAHSARYGNGSPGVEYDCKRK
jgi:hypothetical protein